MIHHRFALTESDQFPPHGRMSRPGQIASFGFGDGCLDTPEVSGGASELSRYLGPTSAAWFPEPRLEVSHERQYFQ